MNSPVSNASALAPPKPAERSSILVADDDESIRDLLECTLMREGYKVSCTEDGEQAWSQLRIGSIDLLITDHDMPRLKGLDLLNRLRAHSLRIPVILISGYMPWSGLDLELLNPGVALAKPFSLSLLCTQVRNLLDSSKSHTRITGEARNSLLGTHLAPNGAVSH
jgi:DNA-binding NtrC family response regulator